MIKKNILMPKNKTKQKPKNKTKTKKTIKIIPVDDSFVARSIVGRLYY